MASGQFNPKFTFTTQEIQSIQDVIIQDFYSKPALNTLFTVVQGIRAKKKIGIIGNMTEVGRPRAACDVTETTVTFPTIQKEWNPCSWGDLIPFCVADLEDQFWVWFMKDGVQRQDATQGDFANFVTEQIMNGMTESLWKVMFFGDTDAATVDASPAGDLTSGTDETLFTCHDGVWKQVFAIVAADADRRVNISRNAEATYALQKFTSADTTNKVATGIFRDLIQNSHQKARAMRNRVILCTRSLADQYTNELEAATGVLPAWTMIQDGINSFKRGGETIIALDYWDVIIRTYFDNGTKYLYPHRALMINKENMQFGCESESVLSEFDLYYSRDKKKNYAEFLAKIDTKIIQDILVQAAY